VRPTLRIDPSAAAAAAGGSKCAVVAVAWSSSEKPLLAYTCKDSRDRDLHLSFASW
jgi:hypothetical protein